MPTSIGWRYVAEVRCMHCGRTAGTWEWPHGRPTRDGTFRPASGNAWAAALGSPRCPSCSGPVYLDEAETIRERERVVWEREKRGRKPRLRAS